MLLPHNPEWLFLLSALTGQTSDGKKFSDLAHMDPFFIDVQPREADTFVGYSTTPGKVSPIHSFNGTAFFQVLASCLQANYKRAPLDHIYTMVTDIVATKWHTKKSSKFRHIPQKISTLRGMLYFTENPYIMVGS